MFTDQLLPRLAEFHPGGPEYTTRLFRVFGAVAGDNGGFLVTSGAPHYSVAVSGGGGVGVNFEYRTSPRMGTYTARFGHRSRISGGSEDTSMRPVVEQT